jgi:general secretion pathway protein C
MWRSVTACTAIAVIVSMVTLSMLHGPNPKKWRKAFDSSQKDEDSVPTTVSIDQRLLHRAGQSARPSEPAQSMLGIRSSISLVPRRLLLTGTVVRTDSRESVAYIGVDDRNPQTYHVGSVLVNGARIEEVTRDHVVLRGQNGAVSLYMEGRDSRNQSGASTELLTIKGDAPAHKPVIAPSTETFSNYIRPAPIYQGNDLRGYQVYPAQAAAVFYQMGLRPGDFITSLNGQPLSDPAQAVAMFRQLADGTPMRATVTRNGSEIEVLLDGVAIVSAEQKKQRADNVD